MSNNTIVDNKPPRVGVSEAVGEHANTLLRCVVIVDANAAVVLYAVVIA